MRNIRLFIASGAIIGAGLLAGCATVYEPSPDADRCVTPVALSNELRATVESLATRIGERNCYRPEKLEAACAWVEQEFRAMGMCTRRLPVAVHAGPPYDCGAMTVWNIEAVKPGTGRSNEVVIVGAHYDTKVATPGWHDYGPPLKDRPGTPGANDNASGVAALLALARMMTNEPMERSVRFVAFVNEEPPFFQTEAMGSRVYARECAADTTLRMIGAISLDCLSCFSVQPRTKRPWLASLVGLRDRPDYVAFISNRHSRQFTRSCALAFAERAAVPVRRLALPAVSAGVAWSDDWAFWQEDIPAFIATDTAYLRNDYYHEVTDTAERLDYGAMADVVCGLRYMVLSQANPTE